MAPDNLWWDLAVGFPLGQLLLNSDSNDLDEDKLLRTEDDSELGSLANKSHPSKTEKW